MSGTGEIKFVLVKRRTRLEEMVARYNTVQQATFVVERLGGDMSDYVREDRIYRAALEETLRTLGSLGRVQLLDRQHVPNFLFGPLDVVVTLGQDGLAANTLKYLDGQRLIGVNPDPERWDGVLLPFRVGDLPKIAAEAAAGRRPVREVTLAKAELSDGQTLYAVNDLFIGCKTHVSARYTLSIAGSSEQQSSSGVIVSTGLGATGWLASVLTGAAGIARAAGLELGSGDVQGEQQQQNEGKASNQSERTTDHTVPSGRTRNAHSEADVRPVPVVRPDWSAERLHFSVREPFPSRTTGTTIVFGQIEQGRSLEIVSQMPENGVLFSDGVEQDFLEFHSGMRAVIGVAERKGQLVV